MKYLIAMALAFIVPVSVLAVCAENEVWQTEITYQNGACIESVQSHTGHKLGIKTGFVCWLTGNDWFKGKCYHGGHVINTCVAYEQIEVLGGECVAVVDDEGDNDGNGDEDNGSGDDGGDTGGDTGENGEDAGGDDGNNEGDNSGEGQGNRSSSGTSLWTRLSNVTGIKYTRENISLQDGLTLYDRIIKEKIEAWDNRNK